MQGLDDLCRRLSLAPAVLVTVASVRGSVPREVGAWMAVFAADQIGTVGGGGLEFEALSEARQLLSQFAEPGMPAPNPDVGVDQLRRFALGPTLTCGLNWSRQPT
jgi:xanthine dehydrogenase accessory factor